MSRELVAIHKGFLWSERTDSPTMKLWHSLIIFLVPLYATSGEVLPYDDSEPDSVVTVRETLAGPVTASVLAGPEDEDNDLFEPSDVYLKIEAPDEKWWVRTPEPYDSMDIIQFVNNSHLMVSLTSPTSTATVVLNLGDRSLYQIGSGTGELVSGSSDEPLIQLNGQRGYSGGVYWYSSIVDLEGRVIEFLSDGETCLPISEMVSEDADLSRLQQPLDYCVGIAR